ncbi:DM13 domain-containing protein [Chondrinema litorale]|uniref:DM13 domain-containing protein n=1 Tax=Chondrinema litorale TaxID=2994555 RepID=UPI000C5C97CD|nr:DM13 domain-containing protein [Chondrinema litorale]MBT29022.1 hypothetical protein [Thalassovita sp.]UZR99363.1 DM13 domain-containing protein [Chondrinema litorale]
MYKKLLIFLFFALLLYSCIGTDIVEDEVFPENLQITSAASSLKVGESFQFRAIYFGTSGKMEDVNLTWRTANPNILSIAQSGIATALDTGTTYVIVSTASISDSVTVTTGAATVVSETERRGTFAGLNSYDVEGDFILEQKGSSLELTFSGNFSATQGPGLHVYLTNNNNSVSGGVDLGELKANSGAQTYEIEDTELFNAYSYIMIYCQPFGVPFGLGTFDN